MFSIFNLPEFNDLTIRVADVGAMAVGREIYYPLVRLGRAHVTGFEPVTTECEKLNATAPSSHRYFPYAIGDGTRRTFHLCNHSMTSSLYEPNTELLNLYQNLGEVVQVVERQEVETVRLDDVAGLGEVDLLKLDVQGAELDVLRGAARTLEDVLVIHTEVEFLPLYKNQPLFADVDHELRARGFTFYRFQSLMGRTVKPLVCNNDPNASMGQILWGDAVYTRDLLRLRELPPPKLLRLAAILHEVYGAYDLAAKSLQAYSSNLYSQYLSALCSG